MYTIDTSNREMICTTDGMEWYTTKFSHISQNRLQFKLYLFYLCTFPFKPWMKIGVLESEMKDKEWGEDIKIG